MSHTKGNWNACCTGEGDKTHYVFGEDGHGGAICAMLSNDPNDKESYYDTLEEVTTREERQANAKLIAATPELLSACQELVILMDDIVRGQYEPDSFTTQCAKQAIEKATGQESL